MRVAIAGYGIEGKTSYQYWRSLGHEVVVADERDSLDDVPTGAETLLASDAFERLDGFDLVIRTAGLRPDRIRTDGKVWSATNEFFAKCPAPIIGVTGTKGKGTTCSLITSILRAAGKAVHLVGNIGTPALEVLPQIQPDDIVVYELSSFQLWDIERSPQIAVVLLIEPDHLDVHADYAEYIAAKSRITKFQSESDTVFYHPTNPDAWRIAEASMGHKYKYASDESIYIKDDMFCDERGAVCPTAALKLPGMHNLENACAAIAAVRRYDKNITNDMIQAGLRDFTGLPHRLKFIREVNGVKYYDDSIATTAGSAIAAIKSFEGQPKVIILGGVNKGTDYASVLSVCKDTDTKVIAIGKSGPEIAALCETMEIEHAYAAGGMQAVVEAASRMVREGVVILSPASSSFDQYKNYADRGDQFIAAVEQL